MKEKKKYVITIEIQEEHEFSKTYEEIILFEPVEIGIRFRGGKVIGCHELKRVD